MKKLIYYKIELNSGKIHEANRLITINSTIISTDELSKFNRDIRESWSTYNTPIIMNIIDIRE